MSTMDNITEWKESPRPAAMQVLRQYCIAFWLIEYPDDVKLKSNSDPNICGGSALLWQTDRSKFLVTAYHVWSEFRNRILKRPSRCLIFYLDRDHAIPIFNLELISEDKNLDLAVLGGLGIEKLKLDEKAFFKQSAHPPREVSEGERLAVLGYPKVLRIREMPYNTIGIVYVQGAAIVGKYGTRIRMSSNPPNKFRSSAVPSFKKFEFPGASGGPVFAFRDTGIDWVGIVIEIGRAQHPDLVISPSKFIGVDGKIIPPTTT